MLLLIYPVAPGTVLNSTEPRVQGGSSGLAGPMVPISDHIYNMIHTHEENYVFSKEEKNPFSNLIT